MIAVTEAETCADCAADGDDKTRVPFLGCDMSDVYDGEESQMASNRIPMTYSKILTLAVR